MKIVSIVGKKNTGKTSLTVKIITELSKRGYNVATIKHSHHSIEMDKENTDTWKHKQAGANLVVGVGSTTFFNAKKEHDLNRILYLIKHIDNFDYVIIEGFKSYNYPKIITSPDVRDKYTIKEVDSFKITDEEVSELADLIQERGHEIIDTLFLDNCGFTDGETIAKEIRNGNLKTEDLDKVESYLSLDEKVIGLNRFVSDYIKQTILGIISTLNIEEYGAKNIEKIELVINNKKNKCEIKINKTHQDIDEEIKDMISNTIKGMINSLKTPKKITKIAIEIDNIKDNNMANANITVTTNDESLEINKFTKGILKETIHGIIKSLNMQEEINEIQITVTE